MKLTNISINSYKNSFDVIFTDSEGKTIRPKNKQHIEGAVLRDFDQQERIELLESAYLNNRSIMLSVLLMLNLPFLGQAYKVCQGVEA